MNPRKSLSYPQWVKLGNINEFSYVGKETVAVGCGCHILFYNLDGNVESVYMANSKQRGDGVACIAGHRTAPLFALAEKCLHPRILVFSYPTGEGPISVLKGGALGTYISMAFSEMEYLVTLSGVPEFSIVVWCWRTGVQLVCKETGISNPNQRLSCSLCSPTIVSHTVQGESCLRLWEINMCAKLCCLTSNEVKLPENTIPSDVCFTNDGALLFVDAKGDVYQVDIEENKAVRQTWTMQCENDTLLEEEELEPAKCPTAACNNVMLHPCMTFYKTGVMVFEPPSQLKCYKRFGDWALGWTLDISSPIFQLIYLPESDVIVGWTYKGELVVIDHGKSPKVSVLKYFGTNIIDVELVYPNGNTIVSVNTLDELQVWKKEDGTLLGLYNLRDAAVESMRPNAVFKSLKANPRYPYVGVAMSDGLLLLVNVLYPSAPETLAKFLLCDEELSLVCFGPAGDVFVAFNTKTGQFFLIQGVPGQEMQILAHLILSIPVVDCILLPDEQPVLVVLFANDSQSLVGNRIGLFSLEMDGLQLDSECQLSDSYTKLAVNTTNKNLCFASLYCSRNIHILDVKRKAGVTLKGVELTGHQLRSVLMSERVEYGLLTFGMDGMVIARPTGSKQQYNIVVPHHRSDLGIMKAFQDPKGEFVISLGRDRSLVCSKLKLTSKYIPESTEPNKDMIERFKDPTRGFFLEGESEGITWLQHQEKLLIAAEKQQAAVERAKILEDFKQLQRRVVDMLDANEKAPTEEQLPISAFDLDKDARESAMEEGRLERERLKAYTFAKIAVMEMKCELIKEHCWDPMVVKPTSIESLQYNYKVDNYALLPESHEDLQALEMVIETRKMEMKVSAMDSFHPWVSKTDSEVAMQLTPTPGSTTIFDETLRLKQALVEEQGPSPIDSLEQEDGESKYVMCGSSIYHYIEPSPYHISQFELNTYLQTAHSIVLLQKDIRSLQEWFNNQFQLIFQAKQKEISLMKQLHLQLRHISSELFLTCSVEHPDQNPTDPEWTQYEKPEMMLIVEDSEVGVEPYISPSEQALRQQQAEEEERMRQKLLADNFRELALIKMMDGVLEVKWEDTLRKDIPKPRCMIEKNPEDYNEDDLREVKDYENKVQDHMNDRQRYKKMLDSEYKRVKRLLKDSVTKFEERLLEFFNVKLRVEASCTQQTLRILRSRLLNPKRNVLASKEDAARDAIIANQKAMADEQTFVLQLQEATADCRAAYESQISKDKSLDSKFKKEFPELSPMMGEVAFRLYRRRPKIQPKALVSSTLLNELGRCAVACKKPSYLPPECLEILKGIDFLDSAANAPQNMQPDTWANICRLRRQRIESEMKIKALALQIAEAENTVSIFQKNVKALKEKDKELQAHLRAVQEEQLLFEHDVEVQIALKQGLVEIPITGSLKDYENAILINRKDVAIINQVIKQAGRKKLRAMRAACNFRRGIVFQEWEHQKVRMHIEDKEDELKTIESVKVIKELQEWLHKRQKGTQQGRGILTLDKELSRIRAGFERYKQTLNEVVTSCEKKIESKKNANRKIDKAITDMNVKVNELQFERDFGQEKVKRESQRKRMDSILQRARLVRNVQDIHKEIIALEQELDSLRMRTYPILESANRKLKI